MGARAMVRADHLGSLIRPPALRDARRKHEEGTLSDKELRQQEDAAILGALALQKESGIDVLTDGEFRRTFFMSDLVEAFENLSKAEAVKGGAWHADASKNQTPPSNIPTLTGKLHQTRRLTAYETGFLLQHVPAAQVKVTLPDPVRLGWRVFRPGISDRFYSSPEEVAQEFTQATRREVQALIDAGVRYIQLDAPGYTHFADDRLRARMVDERIDPDAHLEQNIEMDNIALDPAFRHPDVTCAIHFCRGNSIGQWLAEGSYEPIAEKLFTRLQVDRFLLEYDSDRSGGFEPLRFMPAGKEVVLGLVTTKSAEMERQEDLLRRIDEASHYVPLERLALSPQCGFSTLAVGAPLTVDQELHKLRLVAETARQVWG